MKYITNKILNHGLGSKVLKLINLIGLVSLLKKNNLNYEFIYTPLSYEGFGVNFNNNQLPLYYNKPCKNYREEYLNICNRWDKMFNYTGKTINNLDNVNISDILFLIHGEFHSIENNIFFTDTDTFNETKNIRNQIKIDFNINDKKQKDYTDIKIHIRRGDVNNILHPDRWLDNQYYLDVIEKLKNKFVSNYKITIFTQKKGFDSNGFEDCDIIYDDETLDNEVWLSMVHSDVLVIGKSSYSYSAGILCDGLVIYPSDGMFHSKLNGWKTIDEL
jgi:hypothetical protein